jgi:hypothetical protein
MNVIVDQAADLMFNSPNPDQPEVKNFVQMGT